MFFFVSSTRQVLFVKSDVVRPVSFSFPELDSDSFNAMVTLARFSPKPVFGIQGTVGGANYLNVFGEDPMQIELNGIIVGANCNSANTLQTAIGNSVAFYKAHGVVNRVEPIKFVLHGSGERERQAFLVAFSVSQEDSFNDMANFSMMLLGENLDARKFAPPTSISSTSSTSLNETAANTGLISNSVLQSGSQGSAFSVAATSLTGSGEVTQQQAVAIANSFAVSTSNSIRT